MLDSVADAELHRIQEQLREELQTTRGVTLNDGRATFGGVVVPDKDVEQGDRKTTSAQDQAPVVAQGEYSVVRAIDASLDGNVEWVTVVVSWIPRLILSPNNGYRRKERKWRTVVDTVVGRAHPVELGEVFLSRTYSFVAWRRRRYLGL
jgi:hypothetical protein